MQKKGLLIIISGPSGVGKKTVIDCIIAKKSIDFFFSISMTTRQKRFNETNGVEYYFLTKAEFQKNILANNLLEWAEFADNLYGTPADKTLEKLSQGFNVLLEIEVQGAIQLMQKLEKNQYLSIFIIPPSIAELEQRLKKRGTESLKQIQSRLIKAKSELKESPNYDHIIININPQIAANKIESIILNNLKNK